MAVMPETGLDHRAANVQTAGGVNQHARAARTGHRYEVRAVVPSVVSTRLGGSRLVSPEEPCQHERRERVTDEVRERSEAV